MASELKTSNESFEDLSGTDSESLSLSPHHLDKIPRLSSMMTSEILNYYDTTGSGIGSDSLLSSNKRDLSIDTSYLNLSSMRMFDSSSSSSLLTPITVIPGVITPSISIISSTRDDNSSNELADIDHKHLPHSQRSSPDLLPQDHQELGYDLPLPEPIYSHSAMSIYSTPPLHERTYENNTVDNWLTRNLKRLSRTSISEKPFTLTLTQPPEPVYYKPVAITSFRTEVMPIREIPTTSEIKPYKSQILFLRAMFMIGFLFPPAWIISGICAASFIARRRRIHKIEEELFSSEEYVGKQNDRIRFEILSVKWTSPRFIDCWIIISEVFAVIGVMNCILLAYLIERREG